MSDVESAKSNAPVSQKNWYLRAWPWITATVLLLGWILLNGVTALSNLDQLPGAARKSRDQFLSWYNDDAGWTGVWSSSSEGNLDEVQLSAIDVKVEMQVTQGRVDGVISSPSLCKAFPIFDFILLEGNVSGDSVEAMAFDYIGGKRRNFFKVRMTRSEAGTMVVSPVEGIIDLLPPSAKIRRHLNEIAFDENKLGKAPGYCATERDEFLKSRLNRPAATGKREPIP